MQTNLSVQTVQTNCGGEVGGGICKSVITPAPNYTFANPPSPSPPQLVCTERLVCTWYIAIFAWLDSNEKLEKQSRSSRSRPQRNLLQEIGRLQELRVTWTRLLLQELMGFVGLNKYSWKSMPCVILPVCICLIIWMIPCIIPITHATAFPVCGCQWHGRLE